MARNIKKEYDWSKEKYHPVLVRLDKDVYLKLSDVLSTDKISVATFFKSYASDFLKNLETISTAE